MKKVKVDQEKLKVDEDLAKKLLLKKVKVDQELAKKKKKEQLKHLMPVW